ncbi:hypothetical protein GH714_002231 [Hevea brasiliensis]|uniref:Uncharacterized protein n=1 Tax=Hevea brasiliensis TaxID=3981 RepID=A0A6A6KWW3_HEVBR|nr:hypothetical protein GH714_002231 [Hevea brasiliensis]
MVRFYKEISATEILGNARSFYLDALVESLVLLDEANAFAEEEPSEDDGTNGVSKEDSSPNGVDKDLQNNSKGNKNANSPFILNKANKMFEEVASTSNSQIVIDEANEESKEEAQADAARTKNVHWVKTFKGLKRFVIIVSACNGSFVYLCVDGKYTDGAALWNASVRKVVAIPGPNVTFISHGPYIHSLGFGFDSTDDYKLVKVAYLQDFTFGRDTKVSSI